MKRIFFFLWLCPLLSNAQPEKVRAGITLSQFLQVCPDAARDWEVESHILDVDTLLGSVAPVRGRCFWKYYNDTIRSFNFRSQPVYGPSAEFPKNDSLTLIRWKAQLESMRLEIEANMGKPKVYQNVPFRKVSDGTNNYCYEARWVFPDGTSAYLTMRNDNTPKNSYNVPANSRDRTSGIYTLEVYIDSKADYFQSNYSVGLSVAGFGQKYTHLAGRLMTDDDMPAYTIADTVTCENAEWAFDFDRDEMFIYMYGADYGVGYGAPSDVAAYKRLGKKSLELLTSMSLLYGEPDSLLNRVVPSYSVRNSNVSYNQVWLYAAWETNTGWVILVFDETGGGKNPETRFSITVDWEEEEEE